MIVHHLGRSHQSQGFVFCDCWNRAQSWQVRISSRVYTWTISGNRVVELLSNRGGRVWRTCRLSFHRGVQLILVYSLTRPAILVIGKGRGECFYFICFYTFIPVPLSPLSLSFISSTISSISLLPFSGRRHKTTDKGWRVVKSQNNQSKSLCIPYAHTPATTRTDSYINKETFCGLPFSVTSPEMVYEHSSYIPLLQTHTERPDNLVNYGLVPYLPKPKSSLPIPKSSLPIPKSFQPIPDSYLLM